MSDDEDIARGDRAAQLLNDPVFLAAGQQHELNMIRVIRESGVHQTAEREAAYMALKAGDGRTLILEAWANDAKMARVKATAEQKRRDAELRAKVEVGRQIGLDPKHFIED